MGTSPLNDIGVVSKVMLGWDSVCPGHNHNQSSHAPVNLCQTGNALSL